jgi:hypothetical protein
MCRLCVPRGELLGLRFFRRPYEMRSEWRDCSRRDQLETLQHPTHPPVELDLLLPGGAVQLKKLQKSTFGSRRLQPPSFVGSLAVRS